MKKIVVIFVSLSLLASCLGRTGRIGGAVGAGYSPSDLAAQWGPDGDGDGWPDALEQQVAAANGLGANEPDDQMIQDFLEAQAAAQAAELGFEAQIWTSLIGAGAPVLTELIKSFAGAYSKGGKSKAAQEIEDGIKNGTLKVNSLPWGTGDLKDDEVSQINNVTFTSGSPAFFKNSSIADSNSILINVTGASGKYSGQLLTSTTYEVQLSAITSTTIHAYLAISTTSSSTGSPSFNSFAIYAHRACNDNGTKKGGYGALATGVTKYVIDGLKLEYSDDGDEEKIEYKAASVSLPNCS